MRGLRITLFILVFLSLAADLMRHTYVRWVEDHTSVLDKYQTVDKEIKDATSLSGLERRFAEETEKEKATRETPDVPRYDVPPTVKFRQAIADWERRENQIRELRYFCTGGLGCLVLALLCHWR